MLIKLMISFGLKHAITEPTRISQSSKSCIDDMFTDLAVMEAKVTDPNYGDHKAIVLTTEYSFKHSPQQFQKRIYSVHNKQNFLNNLESQDWSCVVDEEGANRAMDMFMYIFRKYYNSAFPIGTHNRRKRKPTISDELLQIRETLALLRRIGDGRDDPQRTTL